MICEDMPRIRAEIDRMIKAQLPTLRDRFAMAIMSGLMGNIDTNANDCDAVAAVAYDFADAMMSAREVKG